MFLKAITDHSAWWERKVPEGGAGYVISLQFIENPTAIGNLNRFLISSGVVAISLGRFVSIPKNSPSKLRLNDESGDHLTSGLVRVSGIDFPN